MRILFISRAYPPITGGIENQNYALSVYLSHHAEVRTIANPYGRKFLPLFAPYALVLALRHARSTDVVLLGDGALSVIGYILKKLSNTPVVSVLHGLDVNYNSSALGVWYEKILITLYKKLWVKIFLPSLDGYIAISEETKKTSIAHGLSGEKITIIPNGVTIPREEKTYTRGQLEKILGKEVGGMSVLLTAGRLARRKGVAWFIRQVLPRLPENTLYIVAGSGPDQKNIAAARRETHLEERVLLLGRVSDEVRDTLLHTADIFVQPNISIVGDMEGFGLTVLEATVARRPVVASRLEGLQEAIRHGENGLLVTPEDAPQYVEMLERLLQSEEARRLLGEKARRYAELHYDWEHITKRYVNHLVTFSRNYGRTS